MSTTFADFDDGLTAPGIGQPVDICALAHVANGGGSMDSVTCPACKGSGRFRSFTGRPVGACFKCTGRGKVSRRVAGAAQAKVTRAMNEAAAREEFAKGHADEIAFLFRNAEWSDFYRSVADKFREYGTLTDGQLAAIRNGMAKAEVKKAERVATAAVVDVAAIEALFATARASGLKRPKFRAVGIEISEAPATGKNAGALYVKAGDAYQGKVQGGRFHKAYGCDAATEARVLAVAADPLGQAVLYGQQTGNCGCCGRELTDPVSIAAGIGPVCASKWGI